MKNTSFVMTDGDIYKNSKFVDLFWQAKRIGQSASDIKTKAQANIFACKVRRYIKNNFAK